MIRVRTVIALLLLALAAGEALGAAQAGNPAGRSPARGTGVKLTAQPQGAILVEATGYRALIGTDGNLHSLRVGETEMLDDSVAISLGSFFFHANRARKLDRISQQGPALLNATDGTYSLQYRFLPEEIRVVLRNDGAGTVPYFVVLAPAISIAKNLPTGEAAAAPANEQWGEVRFGTPGGPYLDLVGGTRIWGPWLGRQVWELSRIAPGERREIAIRVGVADPPKPTLEQLLGLQMEVDSLNSLVPPEGPIALDIAVENRSEKPLKGFLSLELSGSRSALAIYSTSTVNLPPKEITKSSARWTVHAPDFYTARASLSTERREVAKTHAVAGYRVNDILPSAAGPARFREFWDRFLADMDPSPPQFRMALDEERSQGDVSVWVVQYEGLRRKTVHGWYLVPRRSTPSPALLYLSGYGARPIDPPVGLAGRQYVVLAIDVRGNRVDKVRPRPFEDYFTEGIESPDEYVYREILGHCLRALDFLRSRGEVDSQRIAVVGVSEGGGLALLLAALRPEVSAAAVDAPMLCDFPLSVKSAGWPYTEINRYLEKHPQQRSQVATTLAHFDVANFAPDVQCPVLLSVGLLDPVSLPAAVYACANRLAGQKEVRVFPRAGHEVGGEELWEYKLDWLAKTLSH